MTRPGDAWRRRWLPSCLLLGLAFALFACNGAAKAGTPDLAPAACPPTACVDEGGEDCAACYEHIGTCCYGDHDWLGPYGSNDSLVQKCVENPGCAACCNECAALTCAQLKANHVCPYVVSP